MRRSEFGHHGIAPVAQEATHGIKHRTWSRIVAAHGPKWPRIVRLRQHRPAPSALKNVSVHDKDFQ